MVTYKGNAGNLMQHWTLCELLAIAANHASGLSFIDAHAMAPYARKRKDADKRFDRMLAGLPGQESVYEKAWKRILTRQQGEGYPNSAAFVKEVWQGDFSLLLCETDHSTIGELTPWLKRVQKSVRCRSTKLFPSDWRDRFDQGLPSASEVELPDESLTLVSFDPDMYYRQSPRTLEPRKLYPCDLQLALAALKGVKGGVIIQLSTYGRGPRNEAPQGAAISSVNSILVASAFKLCAVVWANGNMMSLVYARKIPWSAELANLPDRFEKWFRRI